MNTYCKYGYPSTNIISAVFFSSTLLITGVISIPNGAQADTAVSSDYLMLKLANKFNDKKAQYIVGRKYYTGTGVARNIDTAVEYFTRSARQNYAKALYQLGKMNLYGDGVPSNYSAAYDFLNRAVKQNNTDAKFELANLLFHDKYGHKDTRRAIALYHQAAQDRDINAQYKLGVIYYEGISVDEDKTRGESWLQKSADSGNTDAIKYLESRRQQPAPPANNRAPRPDNTEGASANTPLPDDSGGFTRTVELTTSPKKPAFLEAHSKTSHYSSSSISGGKSSEFSIRVTKVEKQRFFQNEVSTFKNSPLQTYQQKADNGVVKAQYELGMMYLTGTEVDKDIKKAVYYLQKAAEDDNPDALMQLADLYVNGMELEVNYNTAAKWLKKAAELGYAEAQYTLGNLYYKGLGVEKNNSLAVKWYRLAAKQGHKKARIRLGGCRIC